MTRFVYVSNARLPTPMAHGLQIMQNCEAFAEAGATLTLWTPLRRPVPGASATGDPFAYYGVRRDFRWRRLPCLDLTPHFRAGGTPAKAAHYLQLVSYGLVALLLAIFTRADVFYSREPMTLLLLSLVKPRRQLVYEAHAINQTRAGVWLQRTVLRRVGLAVAVAPPLRDHLARLTADAPDAARLMVAHDGIRRARFDPLPDLPTARAAAGWQPDAFIVGYMGRLKTMGMAKGVDTLIDAIARLHPSLPVALALVGGPDDVADEYRRYWLAHGLPPERFLYAGQVAADDVPRYLSAFDVCAMPLPWTPHFAYAASPIKLFEYMASGRAIVASDLPSYADVVTHDHNALLVPPGDPAALAAALARLHGDPALRQRLAACARQQAFDHYTWAGRARAILDQWRQIAPG